MIVELIHNKVFYPVGVAHTTFSYSFHFVFKAFLIHASILEIFMFCENYEGRKYEEDE